MREKPAFATSFRLRRCAVPCTGFFEWDAHKTKYRFRLPGCGGAYLGGIFRECDSLPQFVILTAEANDSVRPIHERMPVILPAEAVGDWRTKRRQPLICARRCRRCCATAHNADIRFKNFTYFLLFWLQ